MEGLKNQELSASERRKQERFAQYQNIKETCEKDPDLMELFNEMESALLNYIKTAAEHEHKTARSQIDARILAEDLEELGKARTLSHDVFIDSLNILSRAFASRKLDNNWRKVIGLENRRQATDWAIDVAQFLTSDERVKRFASLHG